MSKLFLDRGYKAKAIAETRMLKLMKDGLKAEIRKEDGTWEVWASKPRVVEVDRFGLLMEPEHIVEACETEDGMRAIDIGETWAEPSGVVLGLRGRSAPLA